MDDDFDTAHALAVVFEAARVANRMIDDGREVEAGPVVEAVREMLDVLGLVADQDDDDITSGGPDDPDDGEIDALVRERDAARAARDFARADALRDDLTARGIKLEDTPPVPSGTDERQASEEATAQANRRRPSGSDSP